MRERGSALARSNGRIKNGVAALPRLVAEPPCFRGGRGGGFPLLPLAPPASSAAAAMREKAAEGEGGVPFGLIG